MCAVLCRDSSSLYLDHHDLIAYHGVLLSATRCRSGVRWCHHDAAHEPFDDSDVAVEHPTTLSIPSEPVLSTLQYTSNLHYAPLLGIGAGIASSLP